MQSFIPKSEIGTPGSQKDKSCILEFEWTQSKSLRKDPYSSHENSMAYCNCNSASKLLAQHLLSIWISKKNKNMILWIKQF
jgi:hypothetical protein